MGKTYWIIAVILIIALIIVGIIYIRKNNAEDNQEQTSSSLCANAESVATCCSDWAQQNDIELEDCSGSWEMNSDGNCDYICIYT